MSLSFIGTTFPASYLWSKHELNLIDNISQQINATFLDGNNLLINTTWFGPQFDNGQFLKIFNIQKPVDRLFVLSAVDPVMLSPDQIKEIARTLAVEKIYYLGNFDGDFSFNFISTLMPLYFEKYENKDIVLHEPKYLFANYNRLPRTHRVELVKKILDADLKSYGIVTLGKDIDNLYSQGIEYIHLKVDDIDDYDKINNKFDSLGISEKNQIYCIPHDVHSLGNLGIWRNHFLNIVSETEFNPWNNMFITEKTWKPIMGLRPFVINGQTKIYQYLRDNGFKTFTHYFPVELENIPEYAVHDSIVKVIKYLTNLNALEIKNIYNIMMPDLIHNQQHLAEFVRKQQHKMHHIFDKKI